MLVLTDRGVNKELAPDPGAAGGRRHLHHHLIREGTRTRVGLVLETGEPREVHHFSLLIGYGGGAINPYLAFETLDDMIHEGLLTGIDHEKASKNFIKARHQGRGQGDVQDGHLDVQSYRGAQIFEAIGLTQDVIDKYFTWTPSRIGGIGTWIARKSLRVTGRLPDRAAQRVTRCRSAASINGAPTASIHLFNPQTIHKLPARLPHRQLHDFQGVHARW